MILDAMLNSFVHGAVQVPRCQTVLLKYGLIAMAIFYSRDPHRVQNFCLT